MHFNDLGLNKKFRRRNTPFFPRERQQSNATLIKDEPRGVSEPPIGHSRRVPEGCGPTSRRGQTLTPKKANGDTCAIVGDRATAAAGTPAEAGKKSFSNGLKFHSAVSHCERAKPERHEMTVSASITPPR